MKNTQNVSTYKDKGWAFAVAAGVFLMHAILAGVLRSNALWYILIQSRFNISYSMTMSITGVSTAIRFILSPLVIKVAQATSYQWSVICGAFIFSLGYIISSYTTNFIAFFFFFSIFTGIGSCFVFSCSLVVLIQYFDKYRARALSIATCGTGVGFLALIPLIDWLIREYMFSGAMLLTGAISLHLMISGATYFPIPVEVSSDGEKLLFDNELEVNSLEKSTPQTLDNPQPESHNPTIVVTEFVEESPHDNVTKDSFNNNLSGTCESMQQDNDLLSQNMSVKKKNEYKMVNLCKRGLKYFFLGDLLMALFYLSICLNNFAYIPSVYMLKDCMEQNGVSSDITPIIMSVEGGIQLISRFAVGFFLDYPKIKEYRSFFWISCQIVANLMYIFMGFAYGYLQFLLILILFNILMGIVISQQLTIIGDMIPSKQMPAAVGLMQFSSGVGTLISSPITGHIRDVTGSYRFTYFFLTGASTIGSFLTLFVLYKQRTKAKSSPDPSVNELNNGKTELPIISSHFSLNSITLS